MSTTNQESVAQSGIEPPDLAYVDSLLAALSPDAGSLSGSSVAENTDDVIADELATAAVEESSMNTADDTSVAFPAQCLLRDAVEWKPQLQQCLAQDALTIDLSAVEKVDAAFLQLLVAMAKQRQHNGQTAVQWQGTSKVMSDGAVVLGLQSWLQFPQAA